MDNSSVQTRRRPATVFCLNTHFDKAFCPWATDADVEKPFRALSTDSWRYEAKKSFGSYTVKNEEPIDSWATEKKLDSWATKFEKPLDSFATEILSVSGFTFSLRLSFRTLLHSTSCCNSLQKSYSACHSSCFLARSFELQQCNSPV